MTPVWGGAAFAAVGSVTGLGRSRVSWAPASSCRLAAGHLDPCCARCRLCPHPRWSLCTGPALCQFLLLVHWGPWGGSLSIWSPDLTCFLGDPLQPPLRPTWGRCGRFSARSVLAAPGEAFPCQCSFHVSACAPSGRTFRRPTCSVAPSPQLPSGCSSVTIEVDAGAGGEGAVVLSPSRERFPCCRSGTPRRASLSTWRGSRKTCGPWRASAGPSCRSLRTTF